MSAIDCPECEKELTFDYVTRKYFCKNCGIFVNRDEIVKLRDKKQDEKYKEKELKAQNDKKKDDVKEDDEKEDDEKKVLTAQEIKDKEKELKAQAEKEKEVRQSNA